MLNKSDILWVRNVKRKGGEQLAYYDSDPEGDIIIHWSKKYVNSNEALKPQIGDIILLFQTPSFESKVQLTHLVTPIADSFEDCHETNPDYPWGREVAVLARAKGGINFAPDELKFQTVNQAHSYEIKNLAADLGIERTQTLIWNSFKGSFTSRFRSIQDDLIISGEEDYGQVLEGKEKWKLLLHKSRERNRDIIKRKKAQATTIDCGCCHFSFKNLYGEIGEGFIECHHRIPIMNGERITSLEDLALVCSNCHRMLHRKNHLGNYYSVEELSNLVNSRK